MSERPGTINIQSNHDRFWSREADEASIAYAETGLKPGDHATWIIPPLIEGDYTEIHPVVIVGKPTVYATVKVKYLTGDTCFADCAQLRRSS